MNEGSVEGINKNILKILLKIGDNLRTVQYDQLFYLNHQNSIHRIQDMAD